MKKSAKLFYVSFIILVFAVNCGCGIRLFDGKSGKKETEVQSERDVYEIVSVNQLSDMIRIKADLSGSDYILDNDDITAIEIVCNEATGSYAVRMPFNDSGIKKFEKKKDGLKNKNLNLTANGIRVLTPPVFGTVSDKSLIISDAGSLNILEDAVKIMTDYDYYMAKREGFESVEEYENFMREEKMRKDAEEKKREEEERKNSQNQREEEYQKNQSKQSEKIQDENQAVLEDILYRVRTSPSDAKSQIGAFYDINNAISLADQRASEGYRVYDQNGNLIYAP